LAANETTSRNKIEEHVIRIGFAGSPVGIGIPAAFRTTLSSAPTGSAPRVCGSTARRASRYFGVARDGVSSMPSRPWRRQPTRASHVRAAAMGTSCGVVGLRDAGRSANGGATPEAGDHPRNPSKNSAEE